jgi:hypothetical protein
MKCCRRSPRKNRNSTITARFRLNSSATWKIGSGMSLQFIISGLLYLSMIAAAWFIPAIRNVETILPDHDQLKKVEEDAG